MIHVLNLYVKWLLRDKEKIIICVSYVPTHKHRQFKEFPQNNHCFLTKFTTKGNK